MELLGFVICMHAHKKVTWQPTSTCIWHGSWQTRWLFVQAAKKNV